MSSTDDYSSQIRAKRLAKLQSQVQAPKADDGGREEEQEDGAPLTSPDAPTRESAGKPGEASKPRSDISGEPIPTSSTPAPNPFAQLGLKASESDAKKIHISPAVDGPQKSTDTHSVATPNIIPRAKTPVREPLEVWEHKTLSAIFRLTLSPETTTDGHGNKLHFVPGVLEDLKDQGGEIRLSLVQLEQAILEVASHQTDSTPLKYLLGCWKRVVRQLRGSSFKAGVTGDPRYNVLKEAKRICMSYCVFAATMPEMFGWVPCSPSLEQGHR